MFCLENNESVFVVVYIFVGKIVVVEYVIVLVNKYMMRYLLEIFIYIGLFFIFILSLIYVFF